MATEGEKCLPAVPESVQRIRDDIAASLMVESANSALDAVMWMRQGNKSRMREDLANAASLQAIAERIGWGAHDASPTNLNRSEGAHIKVAKVFITWHPARPTDPNPEGA